MRVVFSVIKQFVLSLLILSSPFALSAISSSPLTITSSSLPSATNGTAYATTLLATGGTPAYTWSIASGSLPSGLTLAATTGLISGTPTATGTSSFSVVVIDNGRPAQKLSASLVISVAAPAATPPAGAGTTWYIRADGGTRYTANAPLGQCDGKADAPYGGSGVNQHCAFNDYRFLWDDQHTYGVSKWIISGGDTVILDNTKQWRVGFDQGVSPDDAWCWGGGGPYGCSNPAIPAGTAAQHTRILGRNYASCNAGNTSVRSSMTQIFGGYGVYAPLNLNGAQFVDVECLEITRHSQCTVHGSPAYPAQCNRSGPLDDYDSDGITTNAATHDILLQDLWIHGHTDRGIIGPIGGVVTASRVDIAYNAMAGWDFDDGGGTPSVNGVWNFNDSTIEWSGCNQEYPIVHTFPAISCYSQSTGGYGDGVGTPAGTGITANINRSTFRYNTQDGLDLGHVDTGNHSLTITNSTAYGNNGGQFKWGPNMLSVNFENNLEVGNCFRMSQPIAGAPSSFNQNLSDFCRALDDISFNFRQGGNVVMANNTFVNYSPTTFDINCVDTTCTNSTFLFANNIVRGYDNPNTYNAWRAGRRSRWLLLRRAHRSDHPLQQHLLRSPWTLSRNRIQRVLRRPPLRQRAHLQQRSLAR